MRLNQKSFWIFAALAVILILGLSGCGAGPAAAPAESPGIGTADPAVSLTPAALAAGEKLKVVATTSIIADMAANVGGELIELTPLLPLGADPHTFEPTPRDLAAIADAHLILANGFGLEGFLQTMIKNAGAGAVVVNVSDGIETRQMEPGQAGLDPHTWTSPANALVFVRNIDQALTALDPANGKSYQANAAAYTAKLKELDGWVKAQIATIPADSRELVTDHAVFGYYADRYGLAQVGAVIPSFSTVAEPSAQELATLEEAIRQHHVKAVFVGVSVNPNLSQRVADDTGIKLVRLYTGSLGPTGSGAETYLDYIRYNTTAIVEALR